ncbi:cation transporter [Rhodopseudomonas palustris]|uniref:Cation efflux protein n=1 Tax=Rhodopseudomonas palustris (strain DX-1) TaxID=652103 RepID=E6VMP9_RHOPX|nr:cation transporter [Rhodopseudomonas palustris]QDL97213.1 cation transporter [Rhodopseudomonas palustris]
MSGLLSIFDLSDERGVLRTSIAVTFAISFLGIGFGLFSGSFSIVFDGVYSLIDAGMSLLSLIVVNLITSYAVADHLSRKLRERFSFGLWHLEPMVLGLNGTLLISAALYALVTAIGSLLSGGRDLEFGSALVYAAVTVIACAGIAAVEWRANRKIGSEFVRLDVRGWIMSAGISAALLIAFMIGLAVQGTSWQWISPYIDPAVLAVVCVLIIPLPISTVRHALADIFLVTPIDLKKHLDTVATAFVEKHGFISYRAYVARVGRSKEIELYFIVPAEAPARTIGEWDALRDEIGDLVGDDGPNRWLTVVFTGDPEWAE